MKIIVNEHRGHQLCFLSVESRDRSHLKFLHIIKWSRNYSEKREINLQARKIYCKGVRKDFMINRFSGRVCRYQVDRWISLHTAQKAIWIRRKMWVTNMWLECPYRAGTRLLGQPPVFKTIDYDLRTSLSTTLSDCTCQQLKQSEKK